MFEEVEAKYRAQGVGGGTVGFGEKAAVIVVDFQHMYTRGPKGCGLDSVEASADLLAHARAKGLKVYYTYVAYPDDTSDVGVWIEKCPGLATMKRGSEAVSIDPLVAPADGDTVIEKWYPSAFFGTGLATMLRNEGIDTTIMCGTSTSGCIRASVVDGVSYGFRVIVPHECVADRSEPSEAAALFDINAKYGDVMSLADVLAHIDGLDGLDDAATASASGKASA